MQNDFNFCPNCGSKHIQNVNMRKWLCADCGFDLYNNVATAVGLIICDSEGRVLFERRGKEPRKGFLAFPGGFVDPNETAEEAAFRECKEEIGAEIYSVHYLCSFPNTYEYKNIVYKTCDLFFEANLLADAKLTAQEGEVTAFEWRHVRNDQELAELPLAFESARKTLAFWLKDKMNRKKIESETEF
ncbi:MAG: NUDIX domain-containing protein [Treponema sp.]|nr:NUDIX domain-containing protein [Treponema sp.]